MSETKIIDYTKPNAPELWEHWALADQDQRIVENIILSFTMDASAVLDLGCGSGRFVQSIPQSSEYYGIDSSETLLDTAKSRFSNRASTFFFKNEIWPEMPFFMIDPEYSQKKFDSIILSFFLHFVDANVRNFLLKALVYALSQKGSIMFIWYPPLSTDNESVNLQHNSMPDTVASLFEEEWLNLSAVTWIPFSVIIWTK